MKRLSENMTVMTNHYNKLSFYEVSRQTMTLVYERKDDLVGDRGFIPNTPNSESGRRETTGRNVVCCSNLDAGSIKKEDCIKGTRS